MDSNRYINFLLKDRPFGKINPKRNQTNIDENIKIKNKENINFKKESFNTNFETEEVIKNEFIDEWTIKCIGVTIDTLQELQDWFFDNFSSSKFEIYSENINKFNSNICFIKFYPGEEGFYLIPEKIEISGNIIWFFKNNIKNQVIKNDKNIKVFKLKEKNEDLTNVPFENKSLWIKIREFIIGESIIRVK